jgi:hypothetical protein
MLQLSDKIRENKEKDGKTNTRQDKKIRFIEENWEEKRRITP